MNLRERLEADMKESLKARDKLRLETVTPQGDTVEAFDGQTAWIISPGNEFAERASGDQATSIRRQADLMDGPLVDWRAKGNSVKYMGEDELDGVPVRKLSLVQSDGTDIYYVSHPSSHHCLASPEAACDYQQP